MDRSFIVFMKVQMAVLYQEGQWDEIVVDVPDICRCMSYDEINEKARSYFYSAPEYREYKNCFGAYVTNEKYDDERICTCEREENSLLKEAMEALKMVLNETNAGMWDCLPIDKAKEVCAKIEARLAE